MQIEVVEAKFRNGAHGYSFSPNGIDLKVGDYCIVDTEKGRDLVKITKASYLIEAENLVEPLKNVGGNLNRMNTLITLCNKRLDARIREVPYVSLHTRKFLDLKNPTAYCKE